MNKSRVARALWRKVFNDNIIDLKDGDARKQVVREFLNDPVNKKSGWKSKDARFFRLGFNTVAKENNFNPLSVGVTPTPARSKTTKGSMNLNVKSKEKKIPPIVEELQDKKKDERPKFGALPQTPQLQAQQDQASYYSAQSVGQIFETLFNLFSTRTGCSPLTQNEKIALGEVWTPIFNEWFSGEEKAKWVMIAIVTLPIVLQRVAEISKNKKEKEISLGEYESWKRKN